MAAQRDPPIRAVTYVRMSTEHQRYSPEHQRTVLAAYALARHYEIVGGYSDEGISGLRLETRPGLKRLLADALSGTGEFEKILVYDVSRWGRFQDPDQSAHYEFICKAAGVGVEYCAEPFENDGSLTSTLVKHLKRAMAAEYSRELSVKVARAQYGLAAEGYWQGGPPGYGLRRRICYSDDTLGPELEHGEWKAATRDRVVVVAGPKSEVEVVRRIFRLFVAGGMSRSTISRTLNDEGETAEFGAAWSPQRVHQVLTNEKYVGTVVFGKTSRPLGGPLVRQPPASWVRASRALKPMVSRTTFDLARRNIAKRYRLIPDEEMLEGLREILKVHGKITAKLIQAADHLPCPEAYRRRWDGLVGAYAQVGYVPSERARIASEVSRRGSPCRRRNRSNQLSREELVERLASLYAREGRLTIQIMRDAKDLPDPEVYRAEFGSIRQVYELVGYAPDARQTTAMATSARRGPRSRTLA